VIFLSITVLLFLFGCTGTNSLVSREIDFSATQPGLVKVMTFNIRVGDAWWLDGFNCWNNRRNIVIDTLEENAADVISLQEALSFQVQQIQKAFPQYTGYSVGSSNGKQRGPTCAIFYRKDRFRLVDSGTFWFSRTPDKPGSRCWGNLWPRICSWVHLVDTSDETGFYVYNLHLSCMSQNSRSKSVRLLASQIASRESQDPFIVMGDFNMELGNPAMKYLQNIGYETPCRRMVDAWQSVHSNRKKVGTYHSFTGKTRCPRIDHIPISEHLQAIDIDIDRYALNGRYPSDHFPVTATIRVPTKSLVSMKTPSPNL
jgi:endonuclease/exonuclease/phosphatase family metal-dependent hydrolase